MALSWNEIKERATHFSKEWRNAFNEDTEANRMEFLFELYEKYTVDLFTKEKTKKKAK
jgi:ABC-type oligopeptide transport system substrate-binding subunit